jgi:hypothetical protein
MIDMSMNIWKDRYSILWQSLRRRRRTKRITQFVFKIFSGIGTKPGFGLGREAKKLVVPNHKLLKESKGGLKMPGIIEQRLDQLVNEIHDIKRDVILQKVKQADRPTGKRHQWNLLTKKVSERWDHLSAIDEVRLQRDKGR